MSSTTEPVEILLVEDNEDDVVLTQQGFKSVSIATNLHVARDGVEAMQFVRNEPPYEDAPRPDLILLDLNLPGKDGREVLLEVKNDDHLRPIPVVVLTTSQEDEDIEQAYQLHANSFLTKPVDFEQFVEMVKLASKYWFSLVKLPPKNQPDDETSTPYQ